MVFATNEWCVSCLWLAQREAADSGQAMGQGAEVGHWVKRREFHFESNHAPGAILLGKLTGTGEQYLVVGGLDGSLAVFKSMENMQPCALATGLGSIRVLAVGELGNHDARRRLLVALTADGTVHGFDFSTFKPTLRKGPDKIQPSITSWVECQVSAGVIGDLDGDGVGELIVGGTDGNIDFLSWDLQEGTAQAFLPRKASYKAPAGIRSLAVVGSTFLVAGLETGSVDIVDCGNGWQALRRVELDYGGGLPLPSCGWGGPVVCCALPDDLVVEEAKEEERSHAFAMAALDGRVARGRVLVRRRRAAVWRTEWADETTYPLFAISPLPSQGATRKGGFAACGWSGATVLVEQGKGSTVFDPSRMLVPPIRGFVAGVLGGDDYLVYTTADGRVTNLRRRPADDDADDSLSQAVKDNLKELQDDEIGGQVKVWLDTYVGEVDRANQRGSKGIAEAT